MVSTRKSAGCFARSIEARISWMREVTPVEVSLCTTQTARISWFASARSFCSTAAGSAPRRQSPGTKSGRRSWRRAISCQSVAKWPVSNIKTRSPGDSVLTSDASQAPVPEAGKITTGCEVRNTLRRPPSTSFPRVANSGPR